MSYKIAPEAIRDLDGIWDYIAKDNVGAAERWIDRLMAAMDLLADNPGLGHVRSDVEMPSLLFWPMEKYVIAYRVIREQIEVVAVTQGSRNVPSLLREREL